MATVTANSGSCSTQLVDFKIRFRVNNISKLYKELFGPSVKFPGVTFRPMIKPYENVEGRFTSLGFFLDCNWHDYVGAEAKESKCKVKVQYKLIAQDGTTKDFIAETTCTFSSKVLSWGYNQFMKWHELIQPAWMTNDSILLEVSIGIEEIINVEVDSDTDTEEEAPVTSRRTTAGSKHSKKKRPIAKKIYRRRKN